MVHSASQNTHRAPEQPIVDWQPIETAPAVSGYPYFSCLVYAEGEVGQATFKGDGMGWWWANLDSEYGYEIAPTHWCPLPARPTTDATQAQDGYGAAPAAECTPQNEWHPAKELLSEESISRFKGQKDQTNG